MMSIEALRQQKLYDEGLREFMLNMYNHTAAGLAVSGVVAWFVYSSGLLFAMAGSLWLFALAPLGMILWYSFAGRNWAYEKLRNFYYAFTAVMGVGLAPIFAVYTGASITQVFFITAATFGGASLWGYTTKRDLTGFGHFLFMGLIGIIIASIVNLFMASSALMFTISILGVFIFTGLTAWDTQNAKNIYLSHGGDPRYGIQFAISLYLNFINLFQMLLALLGNRE
jgi:FtsH-binding integral membrane protein